VQSAAARFVCERSASRVRGDVARGGVGVRLGHRRRQRRRAIRQGGPGGRVAELVPADRQRARPRHPLRRGGHSSPPPDGGPGLDRPPPATTARPADAPAGNVYYYSKTKDDVVAAVIEPHAQQIKATLALIDAHHRSPKSRLKAFVREFTAQSEIVAQYGCPL